MQVSAYCLLHFEMNGFIKLYENPFKEYELLHFGRRGVMLFIFNFICSVHVHILCIIKSSWNLLSRVGAIEQCYNGNS